MPSAKLKWSVGWRSTCRVATFEVMGHEFHVQVDTIDGSTRIYAGAPGEPGTKVWWQRQEFPPGPARRDLAFLIEEAECTVAHGLNEAVERYVVEDP